MVTRAAAHQAGAKLNIETVSLDGPGTGDA